MNPNKDFPYHLYLVISEAFCQGRNLLEVAEQAILGGVDLIQLREKALAPADFLKLAKQLKEITDKHGIPLIINDNIFVAKEIAAAGIHVGNSDISPVAICEQWNTENKLIGYSIEHLAQLHNENTALSDYLGISPVFTTPTKTDTVTEWGLAGIRQIREQTAKPLVAIGNIHKGNAKAVKAAGADCIAVVSAICAAENPEKAAYELKNELLK